VARSKMQGWTSREWTLRHQVARVDIVEVDIAGVIGSRKSMCVHKSLSYTLNRPMCCLCVIFSKCGTKRELSCSL